ncbi:MAG: serine protease [Cyanobacteria bacterium RM1_2_2]|nr:serine protease [Cyanobacteria bacterium RM1_2_2]
MTASESDSFTNQSLVALSNQFADAIEQVGQAIVAINAKQRCGASGVYWQDGIVVTVDQAVRREEDIPITLAEAQTVSATVVGRDSSTGLAVLRVPSLPAATLSLSNLSLRVGHLVLGAGRSSDGNLSASMGMISRLGESWQTWQGGQIDQWIRPHLLASHGIAGTALLDSQGALIGINITAPRHLTLTVPHTTVQRVVNQLLQTGRIARGYLGIGMQPVAIPARLSESLGLSQSEGVMILSVEANSPADEAGLLIGDVVVALDTQPITDVSDVRLMLNSDRIGQSLSVRVIRAGATVELTVTVGERGQS